MLMGALKTFWGYIHSCDHDICLISIGLAGLTTRSIDLVNLIEDNPAIKVYKTTKRYFDYRNEFYAGLKPILK